MLHSWYLYGCCHEHKWNDLCNILCEDFEANVLVISKKGKVLGVAIYNNEDKPADKIPDEANSLVRLIPHETGKFIDKYVKWSTYPPELNSVLLVYASVYGGPQNATEILASKLADYSQLLAIFVRFAST